MNIEDRNKLAVAFRTIGITATAAQVLFMLDIIDSFKENSNEMTLSQLSEVTEKTYLVLEEELKDFKLENEKED